MSKTPKISDIKIVEKDWMPDGKFALIPPNTESDKSIDEILDMEQVGDVVNSQFEVHTLGEEPDIECIHIEKWAKDRAKDQLFALLMDVIGADEADDGTIANLDKFGRNELRQIQRTKLNKLFNKEETSK